MRLRAAAFLASLPRSPATLPRSPAALRRPPSALLAALCLAAFAFAPDASAHLGNVSYADFVVRGNGVLVQFRYAAHVTPGLPKGQELVTRAQVLSLEDRIFTWLGGTTSVVAAGRPCSLEIENIVGPDGNQDLTITAIWSCETGDGNIRGLRIDFHPLATQLGDWQTIASLSLDGQSYSTVLTPDATTWRVGDAGASGPATGAETAEEDDSAFTRFFKLGVHHIWTGYDHLLFLVAVLLAGGGLGRLTAIVTSFTIAHSVTLGAAASGLVRLPVEPVEAAIALSIVFVAAENMLGRGADRRALVTFFFGLIHGFGFASVLAETALPAGRLVVPLLAFNLGVEAGQLAVVLAVVPLLGVAFRSRHARRITFVLSALVALAGAAWAVERIAAIVAG